MNIDADLCEETGLPFEGVSQYKRLIGKLICLIVIRPDIAYVVGLVSQFTDKYKEIHWKIALRILTYIKRSLGKVLLYKKYGYLQVEAFSNFN